MLHFIYFILIKDWYQSLNIYWFLTIKIKFFVKKNIYIEKLFCWIGLLFGACRVKTYTHTTWKLRVTFYSRTLLWTIVWETASQITLTKGGVTVYRSFCCKKASWTSKDYSHHKKTISKVNDFSTFLCTGRFKSLGSMKLFLWNAPELSRASPLLFFLQNPLQVHPAG